MFESGSISQWIKHFLLKLERFLAKLEPLAEIILQKSVKRQHFAKVTEQAGLEIIGSHNLNRPITINTYRDWSI